VKELIGKRVQIVRSGLVFYCEIVDARSPRAHGARPEVRVVPLSGHGEKWVTDWQHLPQEFGLVEGPASDEQDRS